ncbi:SpoIIE family protein phosphatase (plasmid) [Streptomyces sp. NBC_01340]|uniref:SpoIIE family protein phosphatase n=1 Tax=Streptomyces sp. NBC_01340 TaxID=2903830 RepID=UPI002E0DF27F|nr:SpoIIE family protein phosphatase [Streptomyces sp. NBC_01340]
MAEVSPSRQSAVTTSAPAAALLDSAGKVIGWSEAAESLLGYGASEIVNHPADAVLTPGAGLPRPGNGDWSGVSHIRHRAGHDLRLGIRMCKMAGVAGQENWLMTLFDPGEGALSGVNRSLLDGLLSHSPIGMAVMDTDLRYVWVNEALLQISGAADRLGRTISAVFPAEEAAAGEAKMSRVLETGVPLIDFEYCGPILSDPTGEHMYSASFFRLEDQLGEATGLCYLVIDVTERWRNRQRGLMLSRARECGKELDPVRTAQELAEICVPDFADLATIDLLEAVIQGSEVPSASARESVFMQHAGHKIADEVRAGSLPEIGEPAMYGPSSRVARCLTGRAGILESTLEATLSAWAEGAPGRVKMIDNCASHSSIMVPLGDGGTVFGIATFMRAKSSKPFTQDDLVFAEEFAANGSSSLAAAYRFTQERRISLALQRSLMPGRLSGDEAVEIAWRYFPASQKVGVGGDWVDAIPLSGARVALVVGDVVGHGVNAAAAMGRLRAAVHTLAAMDLPPDELLAHLDDFVMRLCEEQPGFKECTEGDSNLSGTFGASCLYAIYDPVARICSVARAGHPAPVIKQPDGTTFVPDVPAGSPLGIGSIPFESAEIPCPDGSVLAFFTDGLVEGRDDDIDEGVSRLRSVLGRAGASLDALCDEAVEVLLSRPLRDDAALLLARTASFSCADVATWEVPSDPAFVSEARALATRKLSQWGLSDLEFTTELIVSELVTNAIRYGSTPIQLRLIRHNVLTCEVIDGSSTSPRLRHARITDEGGRGLFLVAQASQRWGYRYMSSGKSIWVEQDLP